MTASRTRELLNKMIGHAKRPYGSFAIPREDTVALELLQLGFTPDELANEFGFARTAVNTAVQDLADIRKYP